MLFICLCGRATSVLWVRRGREAFEVLIANCKITRKIKIKKSEVVTPVSCAIKNTQNPRVQFPVGTQSLEMIILSTSQAGLRRRA